MAKRSIALLVLVLLGVAPAAAQAPGAQQPPPADPPVVRADAKAYVAGAGDTLNIVIYGETDLQKEFKVGVDGIINFPFIGDLKVAGLTVRGIEAEVRKRLVAGGYLTDPQVVANVTEFRSQNVQVQGQVNKPGDIMLSGSEMTLTRALSRAEMTALAGSYIEIRRLKAGVAPSNLGPDSYDVIRVQRKDLFEDFKDDPPLQDGDIVFVPKAPVFFVNGYVKTVGEQVWTPGMTVGKAIAAAGGVTDQGTTDRLKISRLVNGEYKEIKANRNTIVQPEDQIIVAKKRF